MRLRFGRYTVCLIGCWFTDILQRRVGWRDMVKASFSGYHSYAPYGGQGREFTFGPILILWSVANDR